MNKVTRIIVFLVISLTVIYLALRPKISSFFNSEEAVGQMAGESTAFSRTLTVDGVVIVPKNIDNKISVTGSVLANESVDITTEISGKIEQIYFAEGRRARKGDLLVQLNDDELKAQLKKLQFNNKLYRDTELRQRQLLEKEAISREEFEQALTELNTSLADIQLVQSQLDKTQIKAPFNGILGLRMVSVGAYISPSELITRLYNIDSAKIDFAIPGKYSHEASVGKEITFKIDGIRESFKGRVYAIEPEIDLRTRTLKMRAISPNTQGLLLPGQFAKIDLILDTIEKALMVPTEAVVPELSGHKLYILDNSRIKEVNVEVGIRTEREVQILSGLKVNDTVLTSGILQVRAGQNVNINISE